MRYRIATWVFLVGSMPWESYVHACQAEGYLNQDLRAPSRVFELTDTLGYVQGFGMIAPGRGLPRVAGPGLGVDVEAGYRLRPEWSFGVEVQYQEFSFRQRARGLAANVGVTYHFDAQFRGDPWMRVGSGYRFFWELDPDGRIGATLLHHGFELLTGRIGYDLRIYDELAVAAFVGADLNMFVGGDPSDGAGTATSSGQLGVFIHAGVQGRFDVLR